MNSAQERGLRLKEARNLAKLTLKEMSDCDYINFNTLCGWELGKHGGLTEAGAKKVIKRLGEAGIDCSINWLLKGEGVEAHRNDHTPIKQHFENIDQWISAQSKLLSEMYPYFISTMMLDNSMSPTVNKGDFVAGLPVIKSSLQELCNRVVIANIDDDIIVVRKLIFDHQTQEVTLISENENFSPRFIQNPKINSIALITLQLKHHNIYQENSKDLV